MQNTTNHSGYINVVRTYNCIKKDEKREAGIDNPPLKLARHYAYDFNCGDLVIHAFEGISEIDGQNAVLGRSFDNIPFLFCSEIPISMSDIPLYPQNYNYKIDYVVKGYENERKYTSAVFDFDELQYFCPSISVVERDENRNVIFSSSTKVIKSFSVDIAGVDCNVEFIVGTKGKFRNARSNMEAFTEIKVTFPETDDFVILNDLYFVVDYSFAFICNRRNTTCTSMKLFGKYPTKKVNEGKTVDCGKTCSCEIFYFDRYREAPENTKVISKTWAASRFLVHIDSLFQLVAKDITSDLDNSDGISIASVHPSAKRRNLIDLQQSLQITGAFEFYV